MNGRRGFLALFVLAGCASGGPKAAVVAPVVAPVVVAPPVVAPKPVAENPFKSEHPKDIKGTRKVFVPQFRVEFVVSQTASGGAPAARAAVVGGVGTHVFQVLTDRLYADFIAKLTAAGLQVVPRGTVVANPSFIRLEKDVTPVRLDISGRQSTLRGGALVFTPSGLPFLIMTGDPGASMTQAMKDTGIEKQLASLQKDIGASPILANIRVGFADADLAARIWTTAEVKFYGPNVQCFKALGKENCGNSQQARFFTPGRIESGETLPSARAPASQQELRFLGSFSGMATEKITVDPPAYQAAVLKAVSDLHKSLVEKLTPHLK